MAFDQGEEDFDMPMRNEDLDFEPIQESNQEQAEEKSPIDRKQLQGKPV